MLVDRICSSCSITGRLTAPPWMTRRVVVACYSDQSRRSAVDCLNAPEANDQLFTLPLGSVGHGDGIDRLDESDEQHAGLLA